MALVTSRRNGKTFFEHYNRRNPIDRGVELAIDRIDPTVVIERVAHTEHRTTRRIGDLGQGAANICGLSDVVTMRNSFSRTNASNRLA